MHVSSQPYLKTYFFPFWSLGTLVRVTLLTLAVVLPFFMTYSTPNFFLTSRLQVYNQTIAYNYQYHITITTTSSRYIYTNLYQQPTSNPPTIAQQDSKSVMQFDIEWPHAPSENVQNLEASLFFKFELDGVTHYGSATAKAQGYSIGQVSIAGPVAITKGSGSTALTSSSLALVGYDLTEFAQKAQTSAGYLKYDYSVLPVNIPSDLLHARLVLNYAGLLGLQQTPSVLGQLIWSWVQYFPIFLSLFWALDKIFVFLVREKIINRKVIHDGEYTQLISAENRIRQSRRLH